jgi:hypothetical protein
VRPEFENALSNDEKRAENSQKLTKKTEKGLKNCSIWVLATK